MLAFRRRTLRAPLALLNLLTLSTSILPPRAFAAATDEGGGAASEIAAEETVDSAPPPAVPTTAVTTATSGAATGEKAWPPSADGEANTSMSPGAPGSGAFAARSMALRSAPLAFAAALPTPAEKTGVASQVVSIPQGAGKIDGMGESFSAQLSTGTASFSVPIALPKGRGIQPSLALQYESGGGHGVAGVGWSLGVPFIARQTDRGIPAYKDPSDRDAWSPEQDRFVFGGGQELVPICRVQGGACAGALAGERLPKWAEGWRYFRPRVEGAFQRFFWSPDRRLWRVQDKSGTTLELGMPFTAASNGELELDATRTRIFRWNLSREWDSQGSDDAPVNVVTYRYRQADGVSYLSDVYWTPPVSGANAGVDAFAYHARLRYEERPDPSTSYRRGWRTRQSLRLAGIDITSKRDDATAARELVRRYELSYEPGSHVSLLASVQVEGRCDTPIVERSAGDLPAYTGCPRLPAMRFSYSHVTPRRRDGSPATPPFVGYEGFDERATPLPVSPPHSLDEEAADLFDVNADGLPDVLATLPSQYGGNFGVFFNGGRGVAGQFTASTLGVAGVLGAGASDLMLRNPNLAPLDIDGDGVVDLVHMPQARQYSVYRIEPRGTGLVLQGRVVSLPPSASPVLNLGRDATDLATLDINGDGLVDVLQSSGTAFRSFFALGRFPRGDGLFGSGQWRGAADAALAAEPVEACVPFAGTPVRLGDDEVRVADMNGDGLPDLVKVQSGLVRYFPGRGNGYFGKGDGFCPKGTTRSEDYVSMKGSPSFPAFDMKEVRLEDVNGDGLDDFVLLGPSAASVWLNGDGEGWTSRYILDGTPSPANANGRVRIVDVNGSGTKDILWGQGGAYRYIDLSGGTRPWLLTRVSNGLGKTTDIEYASSVDEMLAAERAGTPWSTKMPIVTHVVKRVTDSDNLAVAGRAPNKYVTEYTYRDPGYDGAQREFRGFRQTSVRRYGDANSPPSSTRTTFLLGDCADETADGVADCEPPGRWRDNRREALKGLPVLEETFDDSGRYLSTVHTTYRLRHLYSGADGRAVRHAYASAHDTYAYDVASFVPSSGSVTLADVEVTGEGGATQTVSTTVPLRSEKGRAHLRQEADVDGFGNTIRSVAKGCIQGCGAVDETITARSTYELLDDATRWLWRLSASWVEGSLGGERNKRLFTYDEHGNLRVTRAELRGSGRLERSHTSGARVAAAPATASSDGIVVLDAVDADTFGNPVFLRGGENRCARVSYDATYGTFPVSESVFVGSVGPDPTGGTSMASQAFATTRAGPGCGTTALTARAVYDRGLGLVTDAVDLHGEPTRAQYDGLGRLVSLTKPHPYAATTLSPLPSVRIEYLLTANPERQPYSLVHTSLHDGLTVDGAAYRESWAYADGFGRTVVRLEEADPTAGDEGSWIVTGLTRFDRKGSVEEAFQPWFWSGEPAAYPLAAAPATTSEHHAYDAFGRETETRGFDGLPRARVSYHALSSDVCDKADLLSDKHRDTCSTSTRDGHGRVVSTVERRKNHGASELLETRTEYLATGEPVRVTRQVQGGASAVTRWMRYDSLGRRVLNVEPNTSRGFVAVPPADDGAVHAWRYVYDDAGSLVGTSDARGCGVNYHYDAGGRILAEDYSPCTASQPAYSAPDLATGNGTEVFYRYDAVDPEVAPGCAQDPALLRGRLSSIADRGSKMIQRPDGRGRIACFARAIAKPQDPGTDEPTLAERYTDDWFVQQTTYDAADRPVRETTGATALLGSGGESYVQTVYSGRGTVKAVCTSYDQARARASADGVCLRDGDRALVSGIVRAANGRIERVTYGDLASTETAFTYDVLERIAGVSTTRTPPSAWGAATYPASRPNEPTQQTVLEHGAFTYDEADNPIRVSDLRDPALWPAGAKPVSRTMAYDDFYRLEKVTYEHAAGDDAWVSPYAAENGGGDQDSRRTTPAPHVRFDKRVKEQTFTYDALGNIQSSDDDADGFYDRSLGTQTHGTTSDGPYQLRRATNEASGTTAPRAGNLAAEYDAAGNLASLSVARKGPCLPAGAVCSQRYRYDWDEAGRLARARRWDTASPPTETQTASVDLRYAYDAGGMRVLKTAVAGTRARHAVYPLKSVELRGAAFEAGAYTHTTNTEVPYLLAAGVRLARVHFSEDDLPNLTSGSLHVLLELPDHLGSTSIVVDQGTGELVERSTYQAYGSAESDYRPTRWASFREDYRFTGKEEDVEVGLQYFGFRYYAPALHRWISPDPLAVHGLEADLNVYAYVHGRVLVAVDPMGLEGFWSDLVSEAKIRFSPENIKARVAEAAEAIEAHVQRSWDYWKEHPGEYVEGVVDKLEKAADIAAVLDGVSVPRGPGGLGPQPQVATVGGGRVAARATGAHPPFHLQKDDAAAEDGRAQESPAGDGPKESGEATKKGRPGSYTPNRELPVDKFGVPVPDVDVPHTQLGRSREKFGSEPQAREWDYGANGQLQPQRDIDFTDHGSPHVHPSPHQHKLTPNNPKLAPRGGFQRGDAEPLE